MVVASLFIKKMVRWIAIVIFVSLALVGSVVADVQLRYLDRIERWEGAPPGEGAYATALILGAGFKRDGTPSDALKDRLDEGIWLFESGHVKRLFVTADDGSYRANEIMVMKNYLLSQGVEEEALIIDGRGYRTYESCKNATSRFTDEKIIVVTQRFHLGRALYLCNQLGVDAIGRPADRRSYERIKFFWARDLLASVKAWWDIHIQTPVSPVDEPSSLLTREKVLVLMGHVPFKTVRTGDRS